MSNLLNKIVDQDNQEAAIHSLKLGFCRAMSDFGFSPKTAEAVLQKVAEIKGPGLWDAAKGTMLVGAGAGAALGVGSAMLRRKVEKTIEGRESPEMRNRRAQIEAYKRMITNFKEEEGLQSQNRQLQSSGTI